MKYLSMIDLKVSATTKLNLEVWIPVYKEHYTASLIVEKFNYHVIKKANILFFLSINAGFTHSPTKILQFFQWLFLFFKKINRICCHRYIIDKWTVLFFNVYFLNSHRHFKLVYISIYIGHANLNFNYHYFLAASCTIFLILSLRALQDVCNTSFRVCQSKKVWMRVCRWGVCQVN